MYRVYFNREREWPQCWSVDEGSQTTEINVQGFELRGVTVYSNELPRAACAPAAADLTPFAWLEVYDAVLHIENGLALFSPLP